MYFVELELDLVLFQHHFEIKFKYVCGVRVHTPHNNPNNDN